ncbi:MAG: aminotransferase class V-fold PLP-dependent enzyme [Candidatus Nanopelagicales bacterium]
MTGAHDPGAAERLADARDGVVRHDPDLIYLDGNSLGMLPAATVDRLRHVVEQEWGGEQVRGWQHWADLPAAVGDRLGAALLGAAAGQTVVCDSISLNLFKLAHAAVTHVRATRPDRTVIVTDAGNFPSDRYVLQAVADQTGATVRWVDADAPYGITPERLAAALEPGDVAVVSLQLVDYRSGALLDLAATTRQVHDAGALALWELAHAAGAVPVALDDAGADLAVGCTYKYLNAGPGAPGFLYVNAALVDDLVSPIPGWWGAADPFAMDQPYEPARGAMRFLAGSPPVLGLAAVDEGVRQLAEVGIDALREASRHLTDHLVDLADAWLADLGFTVASPRDSAHRGGHVVLAHPEAYRIGRALVARGVIGDVRPPDLLRLAPVPLATTHDDVEEGMRRLRDLVTAGEHLALDPARDRVT